MKWVLSVVVLAMLAPYTFADDTKNEPKPAQSTAELRQQIEMILKDTHTPGASVAIVRRSGPEWVAGIGKADVASGRDATDETLFRIGSTSKAFASMAILLLADQGKLSLDDPVRKLAPEVWFENRWEASDPVRVVNLLEHTTGWDDIHLREYAKDGPGMSLKEALDYDHHSRISRWPPGTRVAYCNAGPAVAAYIVEKVSGQKFEDFVEQNLFQPIGMKTATYFQPTSGKETTLYHGDGKTPYAYWNIIFRPAGSINASAQDMAAYVQFYLNRGVVNGIQVLPAADIERMENPQSGWAAKEGLSSGYGLSNYWSIENGFVYHGHNGGVEGGLTELSYMPEYGVGYFFSINSGSGEAFGRISKAIRNYITLKLQKPTVPAAAALPANAGEYAGWYESDSPRASLTAFIGHLAGLSRVRMESGKLLITNLGGKDETFVPVEGMQFRYVPKKDAPEPVATLVLLQPKQEGRFIQAGAGTTMKQIGMWQAMTEIVLTVFVVLAMVSIVVYAPFWILGGLMKELRRPAERWMRLWPLVAVLSLIAAAVIVMLCSADFIARMGNMTGWSVAFFLTTILFAVATLASAVALWRAPEQGVRLGVRRYSALVTAALLIATLYLAYWGIIGLRTWG
ncbi:MAG TPA: serine hydrolase domain-containing protein [Candidatus Acidoferrum sp.]